MTASIASAALTLFLSFLLGICNRSTASTGSKSVIDFYASKIAGHIGLDHIVQSYCDFWKPILETVVLNLSDQQLLTGIAILVAGFWTHCSISVYHFALTNDLAFFSSTAHLTTLYVLADYLQQNHVYRNWRVSLMVCLAGLLFASCVMEGHWAWYESWRFDAQCLFDDLRGNVSGSPAFWTWFEVVLIVYSYSTQIISVYQGDVLEEWLLQRPAKFVQRQIQRLEDLYFQIRRSPYPSRFLKWSKSIFQILMIWTLRITFVIVTETSRSAIVTHLFNIFWFAYSLWGIIGDRSIPVSEVDGSEETMGFGQIVPILLLSSTIFVFREAYDSMLLQVMLYR